jgi:hypothetical protein
MRNDVYNGMTARINHIIKANGINTAIKILIDEGLCSSKSEAKSVYYQRKNR